MDNSLEITIDVILELIAFGFVIGMISFTLYSNQILYIIERLF